jgi:hypothetical protein
MMTNPDNLQHEVWREGLSSKISHLFESPKVTAGNHRAISAHQDPSSCAVAELRVHSPQRKRIFIEHLPISGEQRGPLRGASALRGKADWLAGGMTETLSLIRARVNFGKLLWYRELA